MNVFHFDRMMVVENKSAEDLSPRKTSTEEKKHKENQNMLIKLKVCLEDRKTQQGLKSIRRLRGF